MNGCRTGKINTFSLESGQKEKILVKSYCLFTTFPPHLPFVFKKKKKKKKKPASKPGKMILWDTSRLPLEKAMAPNSSTVAWRIPWMEEPCGLQSTGSLRVGHNWVTSLSLSTFKHWRRKWQPTPVFLPGESHGRRSLVGCSPWGRTESDMTEAT